MVNTYYMADYNLAVSTVNVNTINTVNATLTHPHFSHITLISLYHVTAISKAFTNGKGKNTYFPLPITNV